MVFLVLMRSFLGSCAPLTAQICCPAAQGFAGKAGESQRQGRSSGDGSRAELSLSLSPSPAWVCGGSRWHCRLRHGLVPSPNLGTPAFWGFQPHSRPGVAGDREVTAGTGPRVASLHPMAVPGCIPREIEARRLRLGLNLAGILGQSWALSPLPWIR